MLTLEQARREWKPTLPRQLAQLNRLSFAQQAVRPIADLSSYFPHTLNQPLLQLDLGVEKTRKSLRVGVLFSGGQAPGGHNVIAGLWDGLVALHPQSRLFGFLNNGSGLIKGNSLEMTQEMIAPYRNQGGFDLLGSGRTKLETEEQFQAALVSVQKLSLDGLIIIGGDDSHTNAAFLAEYFIQKGCSTRVIGVPKTIDGDLQTPYTPISFGFDTACKVYSEMIGNIAKDDLSAKKYYHFIKLMGRSASHITLECALATHPNYALIGEEIHRDHKSLGQIVQEIAAMICKRHEQGKDYGIVLIPEGVIEFIPDFTLLIKELSAQKELSKEASDCFNRLPPSMREQLLQKRDPHGNIPLSAIETERFLMGQVAEELAKRKVPFNGLTHFFGYEGRASFPTNFDCHYCYALGCVAALLVEEGATGYMSFITNLSQPVSEWTGGGVPLTTLIDFEERKGVKQPVIKKTLVDLHSQAFRYFETARSSWMIVDDYQFPGPIQFFGPPEMTDSIPYLLRSQF